MKSAETLVEVWRGDFLECEHVGHAVVCDENGEIVHAWGDPDAIILPRSSCKMVQALPLVESGAADAYSLNSEHLALACASHNGAKIHTERVSSWLNHLDLSESDLRCGAQMPADRDAKLSLLKTDNSPCQIHNNCSGKHAGFLTYCSHNKFGPEYVDPTHPLQLAVKDVFEEVTEETSPGYAIDGCSAPNFGTSVHGLARAMAYFATATRDGNARKKAASRLVAAMAKHPDLVAGEGRACTELMRAMNGQSVVKTGAEAVFVAILPQQKLGVALKIVDGATRASECAIAAILVKLGALDANHPLAQKRLQPEQKNWRGIKTGVIRPTSVIS